LLPFAQAAAGSGFVSIEPDVDGVLRRVPLLARGDGKTWPQFALALAAERLGLSLQSDMQVTGGQLLLRPDRTDGVAIPVDGRGQMIVRWPAPEKKTRISAAAIMHVWREQQTLERIDTLTHALRIGVLSLGYPPDEHREAFMELGELTGQLDRAYQQRVDLQRRQQRTILYRPGQQIDPDELDQALRREQQLDQAVRLQARSLLTALREGDALDAFIQDRQADQANRLLGLLDALPAERRVIVNNLASLKRELSERVGGKLCLIGSTSSGGADFVPTPVNNRTPGVDLHAAVLETILSGRFIQRAPTGVNVLVILLGGLVVSLISATRSAVVSIAATLLLAGGYALGCFYLVFGWGGVWLEAMAPLAAMFAAILAVTVYRQLTEERARRRIRAMFAHALSPQLVDRLIEDPSIAALGGQNRPISCLFSDLAGFTRLSGQIGPQRTVQLLNRYFDVVTAIIQQRYEGYINKFLGDGVFAFFGAPVDQGDHPTRAIQAAIDYLRAMDPLNDQLAEQFEATARLRVRIGITSQEAMVGNCGSSSRMDYTAIGECVNLASRLESANKVFGTQCLVDDRAWQQADHGGLIARPMGRLVISGIAEPVRPWHVLGRRDELDAATIEQTELFAEAMDRLESRDFATAAERLDQLAEYDDPAIRIYVRLVREAMASPEGEHFQPEPLHSGCVERIILPD
jgi:class 3 adenylate cyclase